MASTVCRGDDYFQPPPLDLSQRRQLRVGKHTQQPVFIRTYKRISYKVLVRVSDLTP